MRSIMPKMSSASPSSGTPADTSEGPVQQAVRPTAAVAASRWLALGLCLALIALGLLWELLLAPTGRGTLALKVLPLLPALARRGVLAGQSRDEFARGHDPVDRADALAFVFPVYWWSSPALLKGWIAREQRNR